MTADTAITDTPSAVPKEALAFYYPWYGNPTTDHKWSHWQPDAAGTAATNITDQPLDGLYSSHDPGEVAKQIAEAQQAGLTGFISSWWGPGDFTDQSMPTLLAAAAKAGFAISAYVDSGAISGSTEAALIASATKNLEYLVNNYTNSTAWLKVDGKPVIFIYSGAANKLSAADWKTVLATVDANTPNGIVAVGPDGTQWTGVFQGGHEYSEAGMLAGKTVAQTATATTNHDAAVVNAEQAAGEITTATVIPGFNNSNTSESLLVDPRDNGQFYAAQWQSAIAANPDWVLVSTWNEWHEGSEIEPSVQYGSSYLTETAQYAQQFLQSATGTASVASTTASSPETAGASSGGTFVVQSGAAAATQVGTATFVRVAYDGPEAITSLGADTIDTGTGATTVYAGGPSVSVLGGGGPLVFAGGVGTAQVNAGSGHASMWGGAGACTLQGGTGGANLLVAGTGNGSLVGAAGDLMFGGAGTTTFDGSPAGNDIMVGGAGVNLFNMAAGDVAFGSADSNTFNTGGAGQKSAIVVAGPGTNEIDFGRGGGAVFGASGTNTYTVTSGDAGGIDMIIDFKSSDHITLQGYGAGAAEAAVSTAAAGSWGMALPLNDGTKIVLFGVSHIDPSQISQ